MPENVVSTREKVFEVVEGYASTPRNKTAGAAHRQSHDFPLQEFWLSHEIYTNQEAAGRR